MAARKSLEKRLEQARRLIEKDDMLIYDVASRQGQIVANVKHMRWFLEAVAEDLW